MKIAGADADTVAKLLKSGKYKFTLDSLAAGIAADLARGPPAAKSGGGNRARRGKGRPTGENAE